MTLGVFDLKRRRAEWSAYVIKVPREWIESKWSVCSLMALAVLWCHTLIILHSAASSQTHLFSQCYFFSPLTTLVVTCDLIWQCSLWQIGSDRQIVLPFSGRPRQMAPTALMTHNAGAEGRLLGNVLGVLLERCGDSAGSNSLFGASSWRTWPLPQELLPRVPPHWCHPV